MKSLFRIDFFHILGSLGLIIILAGFFAIAATSQCPAAEPGKTAPAVQSDNDNDDWMFDNSTYTNDPKTGHRVDQYKKEKTPYRDPNALFDSPMDAFGFFGDYFSGFYENYNPFTYFNELLTLMGSYFYGNDSDSDKYYPYDGDPNYNEEDMD